MGPLFQLHCAPSYWLVAGLCALLLPSVSRSQDPVEQLRDALKINPTKTLVPDLQLANRRNKIIEAVIPRLKTISHLRHAYFLDWSQPTLPINPPKALVIENYRVEIGAALTRRIRSAAETPDVDRQLAIAILIAELADNDKPDEKEKFARGLTDIVIKLTKESNLPIRQAALSALGKITADPAVAIPILSGTLDDKKLGPRRLAAYALLDVVKNLRYHQRSETLTAIDKVVRAAASGLSDPDERVRGYCLLAIRESASHSADYFSSSALSEGLTEEIKGSVTLKKDLQSALKTYQAINSGLLKALHEEPLNVQLTALQALDQLAIARSKIVQLLRDYTPEKDQDQLLKTYFEVNDPILEIVGKLERITPLLKKDDVRLRRGAIDFLEMLGEQAAPASEEIAAAVNDPDRSVRLSAARALRRLPIESISERAIQALRNLLIDADPDLSVAAAEAIGRFGDKGKQAVNFLGMIIAKGTIDNRPPDTELRVAALNALVRVGVNSAKSVIPQVVSCLSDPDVRVRREAAGALGQLGRPDDADLARQEIAALKKAMSDVDAEVRLNASEAILNISTLKKPL